jgi:hypothetical protein
MYYFVMSLLIRIMPVILGVLSRSFTASLPDSFSTTRRTSPEDEDESSQQRDENHHASNLSLIILDEHKNLHSNIFDKHGSAVSPKG